VHTACPSDAEFTQQDDYSDLTNNRHGNDVANSGSNSSSNTAVRPRPRSTVANSSTLSHHMRSSDMYSSNKSSYDTSTYGGTANRSTNSNSTSAYTSTQSQQQQQQVRSALASRGNTYCLHVHKLACTLCCHKLIYLNSCHYQLTSSQNCCAGWSIRHLN
jgi:hypothetical protein